MTTVSAAEVRSIVEAVLAELSQAAPSAPAVATTAAAPSHSPTHAGAPEASPATPPQPADGVRIEVTDPTTREMRHRIGVHQPANPSGLANMVASTSARLGVGRAGPRPKTGTLLLFGADHAVTQDAIFGDVPTALLEQLGLFTVQTMVTGREEFLLRPDLGRLLSEEAKQVVEQRCVKNPQVQILVGDGLSAAAVTNNLPQIYPVIDQGLQAAGLTVGTPFFVRYARVGVIERHQRHCAGGRRRAAHRRAARTRRGRCLERVLGMASQRRQDRRAPRRHLHDHGERGHQPAGGGRVRGRAHPQRGRASGQWRGVAAAAGGEPVMAILDPIRPTILAARLIPNVDRGLAERLKLRDDQRSLALITCDIDDSLYASLDEATKMAEVDVVYAHSFYAGSAHASGPSRARLSASWPAPRPPRHGPG